MIGNQIKTLREKKNWSQLDLAKRIDINNSVLSRIEAGKKPVNDELILKFAEVFEVSTDYLLSGKSNDNYRIFSDEELEAILNDPDLEMMYKQLLGSPEEIRHEAKSFMLWWLNKEKDRKPGDKQKW